MNSRFVDTREHRLTITWPEAEDPTLIVCPKCGHMGKIYAQDGSIQLACTTCSHRDRKTSTTRSYAWRNETPTDGFFGLPLWMKTHYRGNSLWAFNQRHLSLMERFVTAKLRERDIDERGYANGSIASRLPKWIKAKKNRQGVLKALRRLRELGYNA